MNDIKKDKKIGYRLVERLTLVSCCNSSCPSLMYSQDGDGCEIDSGELFALISPRFSSFHYLGDWVEFWEAAKSSVCLFIASSRMLKEDWGKTELC